MKKVISITLKTMDVIEDAAMILFMAVATLLTFTQVIFRYVLNNSIFWAEEVVLYSIICMSFVGASMGVRKHAHITVDLLNALAGPRGQRWLLMTAAVLGAGFGGVLIYYGGQLFLTTLERGQLSPALRIPVAAAYAPIPLSGLFLVVRYAQLFADARRDKVEGQSIDQDKLA